MKVWNSSLAGFLHSLHFISAYHTYKFMGPQGNALINKKLSSGKTTLLFSYKYSHCLHLYEDFFVFLNALHYPQTYGTCV